MAYSGMFPMRTVSREDPTAKLRSKRIKSLSNAEIVEVRCKYAFYVLWLIRCDKSVSHHSDLVGMSIVKVSLSGRLQELVLRPQFFRILIDLPSNNPFFLGEFTHRLATVGLSEAHSFNIRGDLVMTKYETRTPRASSA